MNFCKSLFISLAALTATTLAYASDERIAIQKADGTVQEYVLGEINRIDFGELDTEAPLLVYDTDGTVLRVVEITALFRATDEATNTTQFVFGTLDTAQDVAGLLKGKYVFSLDLGESTVYTENVDIVNNPAALLRRYTCTDGIITDVTTAVTKGTASTALNSKNRIVTIGLDATFADGLRVVASFDKRPKIVDNLDALAPTD